MPSNSASPSPMRVSPTWASMHRSEAPTEPVRGMHGWTPALSRATSPSAIASLAPDPPAHSPLQRAAIAAREISAGSGSPTDMARPRRVRSENSAPVAPSTWSTTRGPSPVVRPYTGVPASAARRTTAAAARIRSRASGAMATPAPPRAMSATVSGASGDPSSTTGRSIRATILIASAAARWRSAVPADLTIIRVPRHG